MIYSYITPNSITESTKKSEEIVSVVYNEYYNYKNLLESCTDEHERPILEAKVEVLYEVSISDIIEKIKEIIKKVFAAIKNFIQKIKERIVKFFSNNKENLKTAKEAKQYLKGFNIKTSKVKNESLEDKLSGMFSTIANNPDMYFDFNDVVGDTNTIVKTIDNVILFAMNYIDGRFDDEKMKQMMDDYKFKFTTDNSILSSQFITKYMKSAGYDGHQAIIQYINSKYNNNFLSDNDKIIDAMIDTFKNSEDQMIELEDIQKKLEFKESKLESLVEKLKNGQHDDENRFKRSYEWIREILKLLSKNVSICTEISNCLSRKQVFCNQNIKTLKAFINSSKVSVTQS